MLKKLAIASGFLLIAGLVFVLGLSIGTRIEYDRADKADAFRKSQAMQIAIVTQDKGSEYKGEFIVFAEEIINSLPDTFVLASKESAETGLANGSYGAIISFPPEFSQRITTINQKMPTAAQFTYVLNMNMNEAGLLIVKTNIDQLAREINDQLSYMYIASIFDEFHESQNRVSSVLANDKEDMQALGEVKNMDLVAALQLEYMPHTIPQFFNLDISSHTRKEQEIYSEFNAKYKKYLDKARDDAREIQKKAETVITQVKGFEGELDALGGFQAYTDSNSVQHSDMFDYLRSVAVSTATDAVIDAQFDNLIDELDTALATDWTTLTAVQKEARIRPYRQAISNSLHGYRNGITTGISDVRSFHSGNLQLLKDSLTDHMKKIDEIGKAFGDYEPFKYINENIEEFRQLDRNFQDNMREMQYKISEKVQKDNEQLSLIYEDNVAHVDQLRKDVKATKERADRLLEEGLNVFYAVKEKTSNENVNNMNEFSIKLPNTRIGNLGNNNVYNFISSPLRAVNADPLAEPNPPPEIVPFNIMNDPQLFYILLGSGLLVLFVLLVSLLLLLLRSLKKPMQEEEKIAGFIGPGGIEATRKFGVTVKH